MADRLQVFGRATIGRIVGLDNAVVRNWSTGKPLTIVPSVEAPGVRGAKSLYSRSDVYLFALAKHLSELGFGLEAVERALKDIDRQWLEPGERGGLILARLNTSNPLVKHLSGRLPPAEAQREYARAVMPLMLGRNVAGVYVAHLAPILDAVDKNISELKGNRANEAKSR